MSDEDERAAWQAAADKAGIPLAQWIRTACNMAANHPRETSTAQPNQAVCPHPAKERTAYGMCQRCKAMVTP